MVSNGNSKTKKARAAIRQKKRRNKKIRLLLTFFIICFISFFIIVAYIKIVHQDYEKKSIVQRVTKGGVNQILIANRGSILDRNGKPLAVSNVVYNVIFDVRLLVREEFDNKGKKNEKDVEDSLKIVSKYLNIPLETLHNYLAIKNYDENNKPIPVINKHYYIVAKKVPRETIKKIKEEIKTKNIWFEDDTQRTYIEGSSTNTAQVIGFLTGDKNNIGLEKYYNSDLVGTPGRIVKLYDDSNEPITQKIDSESGNTLVTTIDSNIQAFANEAAKKYGDLINAEVTDIIVMSPKTGEILAMTEYPSFDLNKPYSIDSITKDSIKENLKNASEKEVSDKLLNLWRNFSVSDTYEPGSIFKPIILAAALEEGTLLPSQTFYCPGYKVVSGVRIPCSKRDGHGMQTLQQAIGNSCNVAMMDIVENLGKDNLYNYLQEFGVGQKTDIDLPAETDASNLIISYKNLNPVEMATAAIGQGFNVTPIQMLVGFDAVINGGNILKPYIVSQVLDKDNNIIKENKPTVQRKVISQKTSDYLRELLTYVVENGTGKKAKIEGYSIGGKTGTAQQNRDPKNKIYSQSFIGYFPVDNPEYIAIGILHKSDLEGGVSASMIHDLFENIIKYKSIPPDKGDNIKNTNIGSSEEDIKLENYVGKSIVDVLSRLNKEDIDYEVIGSGDTVKNQIPSSDSKISRNGKVFIYINKSSKNTKLVQIPDVKGLTKSEAIQVLEANSFKVLVKEQITDDDNKDSKKQVEKIVTKQMPSSGSISVPTGSEIKIILE